MKKTRGALGAVFLETVRGHLFLSLGLLVVIAASVAVSLLPPLVLEGSIDALSEGQGVMVSAAVGYFLLVILSGLLDAAKESLITVFGQKTTHRVRSAMSEKLNRLPSSYFVSQDPGVTASRFVNDVNAVDSLFSSGIISMAADICRLAGVLAVIFSRSLGLGILLVVVSPLLFWMTRRFQKKMLAAQLENRAAVGQANQQIPEALQNIRSIRVLGQEPYLLCRYGASIDRSYRAQERSNFYDAVYSPIVVSVSALLVGLMMAAAAQSGGFRTFFGMSAGTAAAVIAYAGSFFEPLESIGMEIQNIQAAVAGAHRIAEFLEEPERTAAPADRCREEAAVTLQQVSFRYAPGEEQVLRDFDLTVFPGESVLLAGRTGAGKSTVLKLIAGLYAPDQGRIRVFGVSPEAIPAEERRRWCGYVEQQFHQIPGTVGDQVSLRDPKVSAEQVRRALDTVGLWDVVCGLPDGVDTPCTESLFSQGQFQMLSIARAIVLDPKLLLLDEITANLDSRTEEMVLEALGAASRERTILSVSHRMYESGKLRTPRVVTLG